MADLRIPPPSTPPAQRPAASARTEAVRTAQQAFFQSALGRQPAAPQTPEPSPAPAKAQAQLAVRATPTVEDAPQRLLRPGSFVDIKV